MATQKAKTEKMEWNLAQLWNEVAYKENRPLVKRDYIYASEIGMPFVDRYFKMKGTPYTNPPNNRSLRKFLAGNIWEHVVKMILIACGVYRMDEVKADVEVPYKDCLPVHGRLDYMAGGYIDITLAHMNVQQLHLPDFLLKIADKIIDQLADGHLQEKILELKAISTFAMDMVERRGGPIPAHTLQGYHYHKVKKLPAEICYVCKDDCRMAQFRIDPKETEKLYKEDIQQMTHYFKKNERPPLEPLVKFDYILGRFSKNLGVEYSPYLTMLYGFKDPDEFRVEVKYAEKWNRTLARFVDSANGKTTPTGQPIKITDKNREVLNDIVHAGYDFDKVLAARIAAGVTEEEEE